MYELNKYWAKPCIELYGRTVRSFIEKSEDDEFDTNRSVQCGNPQLEIIAPNCLLHPSFFIIGYTAIPV